MKEGATDYGLGLYDPVYGKYVAPLRALLDYDEAAAQRLLDDLSVSDLTYLAIAARQLESAARATWRQRPAWWP